MPKTFSNSPFLILFFYYEKFSIFIQLHQVHNPKQSKRVECFHLENVRKTEVEGVIKIIKELISSKDKFQEYNNLKMARSSLAISSE